MRDTPQQWRKRVMAAHYLALDQFQRDLLRRGAQFFDLAGRDQPLPGPEPRLLKTEFHRCVFAVSNAELAHVETFITKRAQWNEQTLREYSSAHPDEPKPQMPLPELRTNIDRIYVWRSKARSSKTTLASQHIKQLRAALMTAKEGNRDRIIEVLRRIDAGEEVILRIRSNAQESVHLGVYQNESHERIMARRVGFICTANPGFTVADDGPGARARTATRKDIKRDAPLFIRGKRQWFVEV